ncbi:hypothetical protein D6779_05680 [Candidatus Parcubacteria bacterium]|nr:MAG: hypothetical protein D6779_05680 [Candidatus Parcubacteria bacterium]
MKISGARALTILVLVTGCQHFGLNHQVLGFVNLLIKEEEPSLAEYARYAGECGGETELTFLWRKCKKLGWQENSKECIDLGRKRCLSGVKHASFTLSWVRKQFSTERESYRIISVREERDSETVTLRIGKNVFTLYHNKSLNPPGGLKVDIVEINGKKIGEYLASP